MLNHFLSGLVDNEMAKPILNQAQLTLKSTSLTTALYCFLCKDRPSCLLCCAGWQTVPGNKYFIEQSFLFDSSNPASAFGNYNSLENVMLGDFLSSMLPLPPVFIDDT